MRSVAGDAIDRELWGIIDQARRDELDTEAGVRRVRVVVAICVPLCLAAVAALLAADRIAFAVAAFVLTPSVALAAVAVDELLSRR